MILNSSAGVFCLGSVIFCYLDFFFFFLLNKSLNLAKLSNNLAKLSNIILSEGVRLDKMEGTFSFKALE